MEDAVRQLQQRPLSALCISWAMWKCLLLLVVMLCPGHGYDTSTGLTMDGDSLLPLRKLTRWDAIYFVKIAQRGFVHEQEWAFGTGHISLLHVLAGCMWIQ